MQKRALVFVLLAFLVGGVAGAARLPLPHKGVVEGERASAVLPGLPAVWEALQSLLSRLKARGTLDPNGTPSPQEGETGDGRGTLDPNG